MRWHFSFQLRHVAAICSENAGSLLSLSPASISGGGVKKTRIKVKIMWHLKDTSIRLIISLQVLMSNPSNLTSVPKYLNRKRWGGGQSQDHLKAWEIIALVGGHQRHQPEYRAERELHINEWAWWRAPGKRPPGVPEVDAGLGIQCQNLSFATHKPRTSAS